MGKSEMGKLLSAAGAATAIGGAYKFGEFMYKAKRLRDVGPSNAVYVRLIGRVSADLDEVRRLLTVPEIHDALAANPPKSKWVYGAVRDVRGALENITPHTERVAGDIDDGRRVGLRHRVYWLLSEKEKLENREKELTIAHASLTEVIGYLTALEPVEEHSKKHKEKHEKHEKHESHNTKIDIDVRHGGPERHVDEIYIEKHEHGPRRVEEREVWVEQERGPRRIVEERETYIEHEHGPRRVVDEREVYYDERGARRVDERETFYDERGRPRRYEEHEYVEHRDAGHDNRYARHQYDPRAERIEERELHIERDPRDPRHVEAQYYERGRMEPGLGRRPESFEDRVPERDSWMQSETRRQSRTPYGQYAEYGAPQPIGAAEYRRRFTGDAGFGDELVLNPQPVPPMQTDHRREVWIEEKEDYRYDEYGNKLPEPIQGTRYPQYPPRSRI